MATINQTKEDVARFLGQAREEQVRLDERFDELLAEHPGQFVLFKDGEPVGFFDTYGAAYAQGVSQLGPDAGFLVGELARRQPELLPLAWDFGIMYEQPPGHGRSNS